MTRIDPDHAEAIETPYDAELSALGQQLNTTYVPFGVHGSWSSKYVAGPPKEDELNRLEAMREKNDDKPVSLGSSAAEPVIYNTPTPQAIGVGVAGLVLGITALSSILP